MKKDLREIMVINSYWIQWIAPSLYSLVYSVFVDDTYVLHFYTCNQIWFFFLTTFQSFHLFVSFIFAK